MKKLFKVKTRSIYPIMDTEHIWDIFSTSKTDKPEDVPCCEKPNLICDNGEYICTSCSTVSGSLIDSSAEWRYYGCEDSKGSDPNRVGMPTNDLLPQSSLGTMIGSYGRKENKSQRYMRRFQIWNAMPYWERTLYNIFEQLNYKTANHGIPNKVLEDAKARYKELSEKMVSRGDNKEGVIASCIYHACMTNGTPRSTKEIARIFNIDPNVLTKGNARFQNLLKINVKCSSSEDFIARFASKLNISYDDIIECKKIAKKLDDLDVVSENAPTSIAAGALFMYINIKNIDISKNQLSKACEVSEVTITKCYKRILKWKEYIFNEDMSVKGN